MNPFNDAGQIIPSELGRLAQDAHTAYNLFPPLVGSHLQCSGGLIVVPSNALRGFWARITAGPKSVPQPLYSFQQVQDDGTGYGWANTSGGLTGTYNAAPSNQSATVPADPATGSVVWLWPDDSNPGFFQFPWNLPSALAVTDGVTTVNNVATLGFTSGATVTTPGVGVANVAISASGGGGTPLGVRLSSNFVMAVNSNAQNVTGMTLTLSSAGKYLIWGQVSASVNVASLSSQELSAYLTYSPAPSVALSNACIVKSVQTTTLGNGGVDGTGVLVAYVQVTGSTTVQLVVQMNSASFTAASILGSTTGNSPGTVLTGLGPF